MIPLFVLFLAFGGIDHKGHVALYVMEFDGKTAEECARAVVDENYAGAFDEDKRIKAFKFAWCEPSETAQRVTRPLRDGQ